MFSTCKPTPMFAVKYKVGTRYLQVWLQLHNPKPLAIRSAAERSSAIGGLRMRTSPYVTTARAFLGMYIMGFIAYIRCSVAASTVIKSYIDTSKAMLIVLLAHVCKHEYLRRSLLNSNPADPVRFERLAQELRSFLQVLLINTLHTISRFWSRT